MFYQVRPYYPASGSVATAQPNYVVPINTTSAWSVIDGSGNNMMHQQKISSLNPFH
ncbi:uncharacterized protein Smp_202480 [Schistosoma mansoni]|uniref:Smp_202480 n=1 Tax=Schistosoma mansoni TaxID=6183 RepID=G4VIH0_SCHMA|nr:uncharacterized protein Smp_202480 [Schistosoma mansoni]|eukprot:XP_018651826.1 uncharacterized protein Smp_202480 [Schistosoma mansoni]